ncbi:protein RRP5 homolog isoform X4 [Lingula anatina]|uniref:Protein RRP5 homolog isoform X4 n=1 Tax=Lingula anatina TaxID=7574 RepID=A0A1S3JGG4_LINAN|nr:protein RRP5 homolog isoform X4 [Lingula anatina]|eukprot:XP_013409500.1 protein RRP5 homolog isoform X4 [Lingula anatina]
MAAIEEAFPRGGKEKSKNSQITNVDEDFFKTKENKSRKRGSSSKDGIKRKKLKSDKDQSRSEATFGSETLVFKAVSPGMLILGCVKEIQEYELVLNLPNGLKGFVPITSISDTYTKLLQQMVASNDGEKEEDIPSLHDLFTVGQVLCCKCVELVGGKKAGKKRLKLTINPGEVNKSLQASGLKGGMVIPCSVSSKEDHGYVLDVGIKGVQAFLGNKDAAKGLGKGCVLHPGQHLKCKVKGSSSLGLMSGDTRTIQVTISLKELNDAVVPDGSTLQNLLPGMLVNAKISKLYESGIGVKFLTYSGIINKSHLMKDPQSFQKQEEVRGTILYIHPTTKSISLSMLPHLKEVQPSNDLLASFSPGSVIEKAEVLSVDKTKGVYLRLEKNVTAFAPLKNLSDKEIKDIAQVFRAGSTHRCRVLDHDYMDNIMLVSCKESVLNQKFLGYQDIHPGMVVECNVQGIHKKGVSVKVSNQIRGFVPTIHLFDAALKQPEKKFKESQKMKCRVLNVDPAKQRLILTHKRSLVNSKLPIITQYSQLETGITVDGFIVKIMDAGVLVALYNNVKGFVPKKELSAEKIDYPEKMFYIGQVVKCRVLNCFPDEERATLSFKVSERTPFGSKLATVPEDFEIGKLVDCKITKKTDSGFDVALLPSRLRAFIPKAHLSDHMENCEVLWDSYSEGNVIKSAMYFNRSSVLTLTKKPSFVQAAKDDNLITEFSKIKPGLLLPGVIHKVMDYGVFVDTCNALIGLAPTKFMSDKRVADASSLYKVGQSVIAKVIEVDEEKKRFLLSLRMSDCYHDDTSIGIDHLEDYLVERDLVLSKLEGKKGQKHRLSEVAVGSVVGVTVAEVTEHGALCNLESGLRGVVTYENMIGVTCQPGDHLEAVVLHIDVLASCLELAFNQELVKAIKHKRENKFSQVKPGQHMKCDVLLIKDDFILVSLKGHALGKLGYLPAKKHPNDFLEKHQFSINQTNSVVVKRIYMDHILLSLQTHEEKNAEREEAEKEKSRGVPEHKLKLGARVKAVIHKFLDLQINISIGDVPGRICISEVVDDIEEGKSPFEDYKVNQEVKVKIIGFRDSKSYRYLPISNPKCSKAIPECTLKPSKLAVKGFRDDEDVSASTYKIGDKVTAFAHTFVNHCLWMQVNPLVRGKVYILNLSDNQKVLSCPDQYFKPGTAYTATVIGLGKELELSLVGAKSEVKAGAVVRGLVTQIQPHSGLMVHLSDGYKGKVVFTDIADTFTDMPLSCFKENQIVQCFVVSCDKKQRDKCVLSLRKSRLSKEGNQRNKVKDKEIVKYEDIKQGQVLCGFINNSSSTGVFVSLGRNVSGRVKFSNLSDYFVKNIEETYPPGKLVTAKVLSIDASSHKLELSLLEKDTGVPESIPKALMTNKRLGKPTKTKKPVTEQESQKETAMKDTKPVKRKADKEPEIKKKKKKPEVAEDQDSGVDTNDKSDSDTEVKAATTKRPAGGTPRLKLSTSFSWDTSFSLPGKQESDESEDSDDEEEDKPKKTKKQKIEEQKQEEKKLIEREERMLGQQMEPQSIEEYDRLVLQSSDSSVVWLAYMAFLLKTTEIDKARAVAERALKTISFREEQEKLNVWVAYMNLENMYGSPEQLNQVFERALQQAEPFKVYQKLIDIYVRSEKHELAEQLYNKLVKRFSLRKDTWISFGTFYFRQNRAESARKLLQRSLKSLEKKDHIELIAKFAQMEFQHGEAERGKTMFENILSNYPKRTDLWSVYIDMMIKVGELEPVRHLFERVINLNVSAKKMKFFFKKFLEFEKKYGSEETVDAVKRKAVDYVELKAGESS